MPFYDYKCEKCGNIFDRMLPMEHRNDNQKCPDCGGLAVRKVVSTFSAAGQSHTGKNESCSGG